MGRRRSRRLRGLRPDGMLLPKVDTPRDILEVGDALDDEAAPEDLRLWAMIETPKAMLNIGAIAELGRDPASRLDCFVAGTNDLVKDTGVLARRPPLHHAMADADGARRARRRARWCWTAS